MALSMKSSHQFHMDTSCAKLPRCSTIQRHRMKTHDSKLSTGNITPSRSRLRVLISSKITRFQNLVRSSLSDDMAGESVESNTDETLPTEETQPIEETPVATEEEEESPPPTESVESTTTAETETAPAVASIGCPEGFTLNFLWFKSSLAIAVDQIFSKDQRSPLTDYYIWPKNDAWEDLRKSLNENKWISESDQVCLLNRVTEVINYWQEGSNGHTLEDARITFPDCVFMGS